MFQTHDQRETFKAVADRVARKLYDDAKSGLIKTINIDVIRSRLIEETCWHNRAEFDALEEMTTRCVVEKAA